MWAELRQRPGHLAVLALCAVGVVLHQAARSEWFIEDAAICFSYARNIAAGEGVVPWPGAERIEGVSDPTWILLLVVFQWFGLSGFVVAKPLAMFLAVAALPLTWHTARLAMPDDDGPAPLFAPIALALNAQFAIWSASGLENSLFCLLLIAAVRATILEARLGRFAASSSLYLLLAWTRPDGVLYAAIGGFWFLVWTRQARHSLSRVAGWLALFWLPSIALELVRLAYFAWPVPNTWYAKIDARGNHPMSWNVRGWSQLREYAGRIWQGYYLPMYVFALLGTRGRAARIGLGVIGVVGLMLLWPAPDKLAALRYWPTMPDAPEAWLMARIVVLVAVGALLPFAGLDVPGWQARALCWHSSVIALLFSVYADGDWMGAYRWMSLMAPCAAVLFAVGVREVVGWFEYQISKQDTWGTAGWLAAAFLVGALIPPNFAQTRDHATYNINETPLMAKARADYTASVVRTTFFEGEVVNLEMDMGAHLWWYPNVTEIDMAGLVDVPMSRHNYRQRTFIEDYVFAGDGPSFGHVHAWWAKFSGFKTYDWWSEWMFELPYYEDIPHPNLAPLHDGVFANRRLFEVPSWSHPTDRRIVFEGGASLEGFDLPSDRWPAGGDGFVEIAFRSPPREPGDDLHLVAFLSDGKQLRSWDLPLGYGLFPMHLWKGVFVGRYPIPVGDLPEGTWDLGFVVLGEDGTVSAAQGPPPPGAHVPGFERKDNVAPVFARGEVIFPGAVRVAPQTVVEIQGDAVRDGAIQLARGGSCEDAEARWIVAKRHRPTDAEWATRQLPEVGAALAACWAGRAEREVAAAPAYLARAHRWDHHHPELARVGGPVGEQLWTRALAAREAGDAEAAFATFTELLSFQPWRAWARRYAEEARDQRLGLQGDDRGASEELGPRPEVPDQAPP